jgi:hypothetical protein
MQIPKSTDVIQNKSRKTDKICEGTTMCFGISFSQVFEENAMVLCILCPVPAAWQRPTSYSLSYGETDLEFSIGVFTPSAIFTRIGTLRFSLPWSLQDSTLTSLQVR